MSKGMPNALAVLAVAERGAMFDPRAVFYMEKLAVGPDCADVIDIDAGVAENLRRIAKVKRSSVSDVTVCILDRPAPRRAGRARSATAGARIRFISDGDIAGAISAAREQSDVDVLMGIGGTPGGHRRRLRAQVHGRRDPGQAVAARRRRAGEGARRRARPRPGAAHRRPGHAATTRSSSPPASPSGDLLRGRALPGAAARTPSRS